MTRKTILAYDDLDSRKEMCRLLGFPGMTDASRLSFVNWCCKRTTAGLPVKVSPAYKEGGYGVPEALNDLAMLTLQYAGDVDSYLAELTRRVKRL